MLNLVPRCLALPGASPNMEAEIRDVINHVREDVGKVEEPKAQALFETTAEVLNGLVIAYDHYEQKWERTWK